ncbi:MAG: hypothetical protein CSA65_02675 [Proteobacteria bacterium]|nr:MAG: hypothetical protein CSA65_02675 [Pseudomonadota bacterium]
MTTTSTIALSALLLASLIGCGGRAARGGEEGEDGAVPTDLSPPTPDTSPIGPTQGFIWLAELSDSAGAQQGTVRVSFWRDQAPFITPLRQLGSNCAEYSDQDSGEAEVSAGQVVIEGSAAPGGVITLDPTDNPRPDRYRYPAILFGELFDASSLLRVKSAGDVAPAFFGAVGGVTAPKPFDFPPIRRGEPLRIHAIDLPAGQLIWVVADTVSNGPAYDRFVRCELPLAPDGTVTIPWEALAALPKQLTVVALAVGPMQRSVVRQGDHEVHLITSHLLVAGVPVK